MSLFSEEPVLMATSSYPHSVNCCTSCDAQGGTYGPLNCKLPHSRHLTVVIRLQNCAEKVTTCKQIKHHQNAKLRINTQFAVCWTKDYQGFQSPFHKSSPWTTPLSRQRRSANALRCHLPVAFDHVNFGPPTIIIQRQSDPS